MRVLVVNAGSSSLKLALLGDAQDVIAARELQARAGTVDTRELRDALEGPLGEAEAVGHRVVHGGRLYRDPVVVSDEVRRRLGELSDLAPLHQPQSLAALDAVSDALPALPAVACFDTAFHATLPQAAATYALPVEWRERWSLRRFGFHGLSHAWIARRAPELLGADPSQLRLVSCHLGAGASLCAIERGRSIDTTMGFSPLEGLVMATRSGTIDPAIPLWLVEHAGLSPAEVSDALEHRSGLRALGGSADMRELLAAEQHGDPDAHLALEVYVHHLRQATASMATSLGGLDALVFTGGVGERSPEIRSRAAAGLTFLGVKLDGALNASQAPDAPIDAPDATVSTLVVSSREDLEIARQVQLVLEGEQDPH